MTGEASVSFFIRRRRNCALKPLGFPLDNYEQTGLMRWALTEHVRIRALGLERNEGFSLHFKENFCIAASQYFCGDISAKLDKDAETENRRWGLLASRLAEAHVLLSVLTLKIPKLIWRHNLHASYSEVVSPKSLNTATLMLPKQTLLVSKTWHGNTAQPMAWVRGRDFPCDQPMWGLFGKVESFILAVYFGDASVTEMTLSIASKLSSEFLLI